jgi:hypothetical protein
MGLKNTIVTNMQEICGFYGSQDLECGLLDRDSL